MSLLKRIEQSENESAKEVALITQRALHSIKNEPIPGAVDDHPRIEELRRKLIEGINLLADPTNKPTLMRKEVFPGMKITTLYFDDDEKRIQVTETKEHTAILLMATRSSRSKVENQPQLISEDADALTFAFSPGSFIKPFHVSANPNVRFRSEVTQSQLQDVGGDLAGIDRLKTVIDATNAAQPWPPARISEVRSLLEENQVRAKGEVDPIHMGAIDTMRKVIAKGNFDSNQSRVWQVPAGIQNAVVRALDVLMDFPLEAQAFGVEGTIPNRKYSLLKLGKQHTVYVHEIRGKYGTVAVYEGEYDPLNPKPNQEPQILMTVDLQEQVARVEKMSYLFSAADFARNR